MNTFTLCFAHLSWSHAGLMVLLFVLWSTFCYALGGHRTRGWLYNERRENEIKSKSYAVGKDAK